MMSAKATPGTAVDDQFERDLGGYGGQRPGPMVICIGGIHGNEPAGARALRRVIKALRETSPPFNGELAAFAGNVGALNRGCRYLHRDLNRMWQPERVRAIKMQSRQNAERSEEPEEIEQRQLLAAIESAIGRRQGEAIVYDLHTTSSDGAPFAIISDTLINRHLAMQLGVPIILGLEESIEGTILNYINELGHAAIGFEAGQHEAATSTDNHEAAIWLSLVEVGCLSAKHVPDISSLRRTLKLAAQGLPAVLELRYRHGVEEADEFAMRPGFANFYPVRKGHALAADRRGDVKAPENGYLFMPLYQALGNDGFFLIREVRPFWLNVSAWLRRRRLDRILPWLPGVHRVPADDQSLVIDTRIARWLVIEICHLLGYRKHSQSRGRLTVTRRKQPEASL